MHAFDRQTDGRTDGRTDRILIVRPRLHSMQRGKNVLRWRLKVGSQTGIHGYWQVITTKRTVNNREKIQQPKSTFYRTVSVRPFNVFSLLNGWILFAWCVSRLFAFRTHSKSLHYVSYRNVRSLVKNYMQNAQVNLINTTVGANSALEIEKRQELFKKARL